MSETGRSINTRKRRGIVHRYPGVLPFNLALFEPATELREFVECYWRASWELGESQHDQEILASPCVGAVVDSGAGGRSGIGGPVRSMFIRSLTGSGRAFGIKFHAGSFRSFSPRFVSELTDRCVPFAEMFGSPGIAYERDQHRARTDRALVERANLFLSSFKPALDEKSIAARNAITKIEESKVLRTSTLARAMGMSERSLQRLFHETLGVSPKWSIQRFRFQRALDQLHAGKRVDFADLALKLGYFDQAHFNRDFKTVMGCSPSKYGAPR